MRGLSPAIRKRRVVDAGNPTVLALLILMEPLQYHQARVEVALALFIDAHRAVGVSRMINAYAHRRALVASDLCISAAPGQRDDADDAENSEHRPPRFLVVMVIGFCDRRAV